jgi:hypothetical protein
MKCRVKNNIFKEVQREIFLKLMLLKLRTYDMVDDKEHVFVVDTLRNIKNV